MRPDVSRAGQGNGRLRSDDGVALVAAIALAGLVSILIVTLTTYAVRESNQTGRERQRASAVAVAEGRVDATLASIQSADPAALPCGTSTPVPVQESPPDTVNVTTTVTYFDATGSEVPCTATGTTAVASARVSAAAESVPLANQMPARRTMESLVRLTPTFTNGLDKAIFGNAGIAMANHAEIYGTDGLPNADLYTNGDYVCDNNQTVHGSLFAQGSVAMANTCTVDGDVETRTGFRADSPGVTVGGSVSVSQGSAALVSQAHVGGVVRTSGSITYPGCPQGTKCFPGSTVADPPAQSFPVLAWDTATRDAWAAAGYTHVVTKDGCSTGSDGHNEPSRWLLDNASTLPGPTILVTSCEVRLGSRSNDLALNDDLAVFAFGGIAFTNSITVGSTDSDTRSLYLVHPHNAAPMPCTTDGVTLDNRVTFEPTVSELLYTPCNIRKANSSDQYGQIYAGGTATVDNRMTMHYRPLPVWGVQTTTTQVASYSIDIAYKRETTGLSSPSPAPTVAP